MSNPKISVIIPVYNTEKYLKQCLDSVINQTLKEIEIICVDDGSTDKSLKILEEYKEKDKRIIIIKQQNQYAGVARNNGLKTAKGKYLSFLDSDDFFELTMLEEMYNKAEEDQSDVVVCGWYNYNNKTKHLCIKSKFSPTISKQSPFNPKSLSTSLFDICFPNPWTKMFKRSLFVENDLSFKEYKSCNDLTCIYTALALSEKISFINKPFVYYRNNQTSNLTANRSKNIKFFLYSINELEKNLLHFNKFETFKQTFYSRCEKSLNWELSLCTPRQKQETKQLARDILFEDLYKKLYNKKQ